MKTQEIQTRLAEGLQKIRWEGRNVLLIVPDGTRTAPVGDMVRGMYPVLRDQGLHVDLIVALGTHEPLGQEAMLAHLGMTEASYAANYADMKLMNHRWNDPGQLTRIGELSEDRIAEISGGLMREKVALTLNRAIHSYDHLLILGPVFPHEIAGFSGGAKYLFPGICGPEMIDFLHWLGAVITNLRIIGRRDNPVRRILDEAAASVGVPVSAISLVVHRGEIAHLSVGPLVESWQAAVEHAARLHIVRKPRRFRRVLSCAPKMYEDMWTGGKCMYKCEPVVADRGEIIIYAPHVSSFSVTHGHILQKIGYHVRDYYLKQMGRFAGIPRVAMAISTYVKGSGTYENGVEKPRIRVSLATAIPREACERAGLGYVDPTTIDADQWRDREDEGILFVEKAGETLYLPQEDAPK